MQHLKHFCAALTVAALGVLSFGSHSSLFAQGLTIGKLHMNDPHLRIVIPYLDEFYWTHDRFGPPQEHTSNQGRTDDVLDIQITKTGMKTFSARFDTGHLSISARSYYDTEYYRFDADYDSVRQVFSRLTYSRYGNEPDHFIQVSLVMRDVPVVFQDTALIVPPMLMDSMHARTSEFLYHAHEIFRGSGATTDVTDNTAICLTGSMQLMLGETFMANVKSQKPAPTAILQIFPNPASNQVQITSGDKLSSIAIRDVTGRVVFDDRSAPASSRSIDTRAFPNGTYFVTGRMGSRDVVAKFVVNKW